MPYIGTQPLTGQFKKLDAITVVNGQAAYTLNHNGAAYKPATANALLVSVNGVIQAAGDAFNISGSTITFTENLVTGDVIDFIIALGDTGSAVTPVDGSVTTAKLGDDSVTKAKIATTELDLATIKDGSGTNTAMTIDSTGRILTPARPAFSCRPNGSINVAENPSGWKTTVFGIVDFDIGNNLNAGGYFVCPVTGIYQFNLHMRLDSVGSGITIICLGSEISGTSTPTTNANLYYNSYVINGAPNSTYDSLATSVTISMTAGDTVMPWHYSSDTSYTVQVASSFSGFLVG